MGRENSGPARKYEIGQRFGRWTLVRRLGYQGGNRSRWLMRCDCGDEYEVIASNVTNGGSTQCARCAGKGRVGNLKKGKGK